MGMFETFDAIVARAPKLIAIFVLVLVIGLIVTDVVVTALTDPPAALNVTPPSGERIECVKLPGGPPVCDVTPPEDPQLVGPKHANPIHAE